MEISKTRALVTGGSAGIGYAIARALRERGATVGINGRDGARLAAAAGELGCTAHPGDVGDAAQAEAVVASFVAEHGDVDLLVNNAGFGRFAPLVDTSKEDFEAVWRTNVLGAFLMGRAVARRLVPRRCGAIVNISSTAGTKGFQGGTAYVASKFALRGMTECWREELRRHDVRVLLVNPSEVQTEFAARAGHARPHSPKKLVADDIAGALLGVLATDPRGFVPEFSVFATNPFPEE
jgi:3-oxoacyl-[acyl-carrier protein] reductase